jgi:hypothetical protein
MDTGILTPDGAIPAFTDADKSGIGTSTPLLGVSSLTGRAAVARAASFLLKRHRSGFGRDHEKSVIILALFEWADPHHWQFL